MTDLPMQVDRRLSRSTAWIGGFIIAGALFGATVAPGLLWGDSAEAQLHVLLDDWYVNGEIARSHVLYYAIARFVHWLLPLEAALVANLVSTLAGAVTIANLAWLFATFCRSRTAVLGGTALILLSHTLWQLSTSAEVVTLTTALLSAELVLLCKLLETGRLPWLAAVALANGLGVSNHNFALLMWPVYGVVIVWRWSGWHDRRLAKILTGLGGLILGLIPVLILCVDDLLARGSLSATLESFLVGRYGRMVANFQNLPVLLVRSAGITLLNFPTPVVLLAIPGIWHARRTARPAARAVLIGGLIVHGAFAVRYAVPDQHTFLVPTFLFVALFAGAGIDWFLTRYRRPLAAVSVIVLSHLGPLAYALAPVILSRHAPAMQFLPEREVPYRDRFNWALRPWRTGYHGPEKYAQETLEGLPLDAWLIVDSTLAAPLNYVQVTRSLRRDVRLDSWIARQDWLEPVDVEEAREAKLAAGLMFAGTNHPQYVPPWLRGQRVRFVPTGHVFHVQLLEKSD